MEFFEPQVSLYKHNYADGDSEYFLNIITFTDNTALYSNGSSIDDSRVGENQLGIEIIIHQNPDVPVLESVHPVSHIIVLGALANGDDITFTITVTVDGESGAYEAKEKPITKTIKSDPIEIDRPIGDDDTVEAVWQAHFGSTLSF
jgi:hypothetical protein